MFLSDIAEFETAYGRYLKNKLGDTTKPSYSPGFDPNVWQKRSKLERQGISTDNLGNVLKDNAYPLSEKQIKRNIDSGTRELYNRDDLFSLPDSSVSRKTQTGYTKRRFDGDTLNKKLSKQERINRLSKKSRDKFQNPWDISTETPKPLPVKDTFQRINQPQKPLLALPPANPNISTPPKQNVKTTMPTPVKSTTKPSGKMSSKFLNKYSLGAAGILGTGIAGYGVHKLLTRKKGDKK